MGDMNPLGEFDVTPVDRKVRTAVPVGGLKV